jgi:KUP system potassium uptake protein
VILAGLFFMQKFGTAKIGAVFGPILLVWFSTISVLGAISVIETPAVLWAINPFYAVNFLFSHGHEAFFVLGAVFLVATGGESLYADMGHFGKSPIRMAWFSVVLPGLLLNYLGQGALLLRSPEAAENPFYKLAPEWLLLPLIVLATMAAVIASQAVIAGVFSLTRQAIQLGFCPRLQIVHTSRREIGQIYLPQVNWMLFIATILLVINFGSSSNLAAAYGISVSTTMVITTLLLFLVQTYVWKWRLWVAVPVSIFFITVDTAYMSANMLKIGQGGWLPLLIGFMMYLIMTTWRKGRMILAERLRNASIPLQDFLKRAERENLPRVPGVAVFMVGDPETTPPALVHNVKHNKVLHNIVLVLTVLTKEIPHVRNKDRVFVEKISDNFYRAVAHYGFIDSPNVMEIIERCRIAGLDIRIEDITFFLGRETLIASERPGMAIWREHLFSFLSRNAQRATAFFNIPVDQVIEVGIQVEL